MTTPQQQILDKCKEVFAVAQAKFGLDMSKVSVGFDLKGRAAGMASMRGRQFAIRFNRDMLTREAFDHVLNSTVPHEIAHIACFMNPVLGSSHNSGWERVCKALGGTGVTRHKEEVVHGRGYTYEYCTDLGNKVRMGDKHHAMVQGGIPLTYKRGMGRVPARSGYTIVGHQGRTLATPVVKAGVLASSPTLTKLTPVQSIIGVPPAPPVVQTRTVASATLAMGGSKAAVSRSIMLAGHGQGKSYEEIITAMIAACGYDRQLARATYKANYQKVGVPMPE